MIPRAPVTGRCRRRPASPGKEAAKEALKTLGLSAKRSTLPKASDDAGTGDALWFVEGKGRAWLDFANDVTTKDVKLAAQEGFKSVEHMKRYTTQGMAPDQGKSSNIAALALLADTTGRGIPRPAPRPTARPSSPSPSAPWGGGGAEGLRARTLHHLRPACGPGARR
jgi:hypothetical protein